MVVKRNRFSERAREIVERDAPELAAVCTPTKFDDKNSIYNLFNQAYHLHRWMKGSSFSVVDMDSIVEFGGGYGAMALLCHRLGFNGKYTIIDFLELIAIQKHYLSAEQITCDYVESPSGLDAVPDADLLIACHSISEADIATRQTVLLHSYRSYMIAYHTRFGGINNVEYFDDYIKCLPRITWQHMDSLRGYFLVGRCD